MSLYWLYEQNNSGGKFIKPAIKLWVYAPTEEEADKIAVENGVYWFSVGDCSCCGSRWGAADYGIEEIPDYLWTISDWYQKMADEAGIPARLLIKGEQK